MTGGARRDVVVAVVTGGRMVEVLVVVTTTTPVVTGAAGSPAAVVVVVDVDDVDDVDVEVVRWVLRPVLARWWVGLSLPPSVRTAASSIEPSLPPPRDTTRTAASATPR